MELLVNQVLIVLEGFFSAPGARAYAAAYARETDLDESEIESFYNSGEGENDSATELAVRNMTEHQLYSMMTDLQSMNDEYRDSLEPQDYVETYGEIGRIIDSWAITKLAS